MILNFLKDPLLELNDCEYQKKPPQRLKKKRKKKEKLISYLCDLLSYFLRMVFTVSEKISSGSLKL